MGAARLLSLSLAGVMVAQAGLGLVRPGLYRDTGYVAETWLGNDLVTLVLAVPLLLGALALERHASITGRLLWCGLLGYAAYNYAFYLFGAALNAFLPIYVLGVVLSVTALILVLSRTDARMVAAGFGPRTPARPVAAYLMLVAVALSVVWLSAWASHVFAGRPTPGDTEAFKLVAAMDLTVMVPALGAGGALLWARRPWGYVIASVAAVQGSLYLLILALNGALFIARDLAEWPGELPIWGGLWAATTTGTVFLLRGARGARLEHAPGRSRPAGR